MGDSYYAFLLASRKVLSEKGRDNPLPVLSVYQYREPPRLARYRNWNSDRSVKQSAV